MAWPIFTFASYCPVVHDPGKFWFNPLLHSLHCLDAALSVGWVSLVGHLVMQEYSHTPGLHSLGFCLQCSLCGKHLQICNFFLNITNQIVSTNNEELADFTGSYFKSVSEKKLSIDFEDKPLTMGH